MTKPQGPALVDDVQPMPAADEFAQRLVQRHEVAADAADVPHFAVAAGFGQRDVDAVLVHVQTNVHSGGARFPHGPSPRKLATTRPTIGPVRWCSSARLVRATYVVAGDGPPEFTKPSCLAVMGMRQRNIALTSAAVVAGVLASLVRPERLLAAEAPAYVQLLLGALAVAVWLCVLTPFWLPEVVPTSWPRMARVLRWLSGGLLVVACGAAMVLAVREPGALSLWLLCLVAAVFAARHLRIAVAGRGKVSVARQ